MGRLDGKAAVIVGGSSGFGLDIAQLPGDGDGLATADGREGEIRFFMFRFDLIPARRRG